MKRFTFSCWYLSLYLTIFIFCLNLSAWSLEFIEWQKLDEPIGEGIQSVAFSSTGKYFALSSNNKIVLYDQDWNLLWQEDGIDSGYLGQLLSFSPDDHYLAFARYGALSKVGILEIPTLDILLSWNVGQSTVQSIKFSFNGKFLATGSNKGVTIWKASSRFFPQLQKLSGHDSSVAAISFSPKSRYLATGSLGIIKIWRILGSRFTNIDNIKDPNFDPKCLNFSSDEKYLYASGSKKIKIWQINGSRFQLIDIMNTEPVDGRSMTVTNDRQVMAVCGDNWTVKTFFLQDSNYLVGPDLNSHEGNVYSLDFSPNGQYLATGSYFDRAVRIWKIVPDEVEAISDTEPPQIQITKPEPQRGFKIKQNKNQVLVEGIVTDESPIESVLVNGQLANLDHSTGKFQLDLILADGLNQIEVIAIDTFQNSRRSSLEVLVEKLSSNLGVYHALLVAVEDYQHPSITDLEFPSQDTQQLAKVIKEEYQFSAERVQILTNPTRVELIESFDQLSNALTEEDNLLIFYSGHGFWDERLKTGFWLPADAKQSSRSAWLSNSTVRDYIGGIPSQHTLLISDACFSGSIFKTRSAFDGINTDNEIKEEGIKKIYNMPSRRAISSGAMETVPDRSVFLKYLIKNLKRNGSKFLLSEQLFVKMKPGVINNSPTNQAPLTGVIQQAGDEGGDFIFLRRN